MAPVSILGEILRRMSRKIRYFVIDNSFRPLDGNTFRSGLFKEIARVPAIRNIPIPLPHAYVMGMDMQHSVIENGFIAYLLGKKAERGWVHFYLAAFLLKTPGVFLCCCFSPR